MAKPGPRSASNANGQAGTHPDARTIDPSRAGQPGSVAVAPVPLVPVEEMRANHEKLTEES